MKAMLDLDSRFRFELIWTVFSVLKYNILPHGLELFYTV